MKDELMQILENYGYNTAINDDKELIARIDLAMSDQFDKGYSLASDNLDGEISEAYDNGYDYGFEAGKDDIETETTEAIDDLTSTIDYLEAENSILTGEKERLSAIIADMQDHIYDLQRYIECQETEISNLRDDING